MICSLYLGKVKLGFLVLYIFVTYDYDLLSHL